MIASVRFTLADAYLTVAREHGFPSWARLRAHLADPARDPLDRPHHERIRDAAFRRAVELLDDGDVDRLREHLQVWLLVKRGARLDIRDIHYGGTALEWAEHGGRAEVVRYLRGPTKG